MASTVSASAETISRTGWRNLRGFLLMAGLFDVGAGRGHVDARPFLVGLPISSRRYASRAALDGLGLG
jgi:hypothetical protein